VRCGKCGEESRLWHECSGRPAGKQSILQEAAPPLRFAPLYYLGQAIAIARFDDTAILRNSRDNNAFLYGVPLWFVATTPMVWSMAKQHGISSPASLVFLIIALPLAFVLQLAVWGLCHLVARFVLRGRGGLAGIVRVMLLGSIVSVLWIIPLLGTFLVGFGSLAIMMLAFESIHGIRPMHAFAISFGAGLLIGAVGLL
jgi:hypothetical protein